MGTIRAAIPVESEPRRRDLPLRDRPERSTLNKQRNLGPRAASAPAPGLRALAKAIEKGVRPVAYPVLIAGVLIAFLTLTFLAARLVTALFDFTSLGVFLAAWALASGVGVLLVRQLPRLLGQSIAGAKSWGAPDEITHRGPRHPPSPGPA